MHGPEARNRVRFGIRGRLFEPLEQTRSTVAGSRHVNRSREELRWYREDGASVPLLPPLWAVSIT